MNDKNIDKLYELRKIWIENNSEINLDNISDFTIHLMKLVQDIVKNKNEGDYKKDLVLKVLRKFMDEIEWENDKAEFLFEMVIPNLIDQIISVANGSINLGKMKQKICSCFQL